MIIYLIECIDRVTEPLSAVIEVIERDGQYHISNYTILTGNVCICVNIKYVISFG